MMQLVLLDTVSSGIYFNWQQLHNHGGLSSLQLKYRKCEYKPKHYCYVIMY